MAKTKKISDTLPRGEWEALASVGDAKRFLRSVILRTEAGELDLRVAGCLGQLTSYLLKCLEISDLASRIARIEQVLARKGQPASPLPIATNGNGADHNEEVI